MDQVFAESMYENIIFIGCGTSFYLAQSAAHLFASQTGLDAKAVPCSEIYYYPKRYVGCHKHTLVIPMTRKSITTEVRMAIDCVRKLENVRTLSITCDPESKTYNDYMIHSPEAHEDSVVMTRSYSSMLYIALIMSLYVAGKKDEITALLNLPRLAGEALPKIDAFTKMIVNENPGINLYVTLGQGEFFGIAAESMNKVKEMGLVHSEAYYSLEYRHGPMSIADKHTLILLFSKRDCEAHETKLLSQLKGFGARVAVIGEDVEAFEAPYKLSLKLGIDDMSLAPVISFAGQLLGYHTADSKGLDADGPRNLSQAIVL